MKIEEILQLVDSVSNSALAEFKYEEGGVKLSLRKAVAQGGSVQEAPTTAQAAAYNAAQPPMPEGSTGIQIMTDAPVAVEGNVVKSPLVGTFYAAPSEDAAPFVSVGDSVKEGQILAIVEAMKLMNDIESEFTGTIAEVLVHNGDTVEYGQPLFVIK